MNTSPCGKPGRYDLYGKLTARGELVKGAAPPTPLILEKQLARLYGHRDAVVFTGYKFSRGSGELRLGDGSIVAKLDPLVWDVIRQEGDGLSGIHIVVTYNLTSFNFRGRTEVFPGVFSTNLNSNVVYRNALGYPVYTWTPTHPTPLPGSGIANTLAFPLDCADAGRFCSWWTIEQNDVGWFEDVSAVEHNVWGAVQKC